MPVTYEQENLSVQLTTPLGANKLLVRRFEGEERISGIFHYQFEMFSEDPALVFDDIIGKAITFQIGQSSGDNHYISGIVGRFAETGSDGRVVFYRADVYPWLWLLNFSAGCKIYQNKSTPDIVKQVFQDLGFSDFTDNLTRSYAPREYCVQYRETAFAFVSRLLEEEGIFYFFTHDDSGHKLVLADDASSWKTTQGLTQARFTPEPDAWRSDDIVSDFTIERNITTGKYQCDDYNFETPDTDLLASAAGPDTSRCVYDFPGLYKTQSDGEATSALRLSALEVNKNKAYGNSLCRAFYAGSKFTLTGHYRADANGDYVVSTLRVQGNAEDYSNTFEAFPAASVFRPALYTPRPTIPGTQVAVVVGKSGEEIWADMYGRIKVQFFWDQDGTLDENSSCFIRVAQPWAGKQWGGMFTPRIGQEVVVSFLDGNPDRPVVIGSLYNASQTVPYTLPDSQTRSTIKTNSSKGGGGFNEIRFEDKAGSEEFFLQAQKDMNVTVLNNYSSTVTKDFNLKVSGNITIEASGTVSIKSGTTFTNEAGSALTNKAATTLTNQAGSDLTNKADASLTNQAGSAMTNKAGAGLTNQAATDLTNKAGASLTNDAATSLTNKAGTTLTNQASASQTVDGGGQLSLKGGLVKVN